MPHADSSLVPDTIQTKQEFWDHIHEQLDGLLDGQRHWVSNLANASSLIYNSLLAFPKFFGPSEDKAVNWCGFYIDSALFPSSRFPGATTSDDTNRLLLGPFCGKPACQFIQTAPGKARGVCADAYLQRKTLLVPEVDLYPGHIACDGDTKSEIVVPLIHSVEGEIQILGVLDLDCLAVRGFDNVDQLGLEKIAKLVVDACNW
ncbi:GAF domain-like protein [Gymnopilus junonius]|uniref:GAF domain-like protein n=1 Tax=Gymnopilus junonius TaxID=109634 RepID=A0A9P5TPB6_GYMJU|nr:GAF domain-like protein [Gymnopilus junonius]